MSAGALKVALAGVLGLVLATAGGIWKVQGWRYGKRLADQAGLHQSGLDAISNAAAAAQRAEQEKRFALEPRLSFNDHPDIRRVFEGFHFETLDIRYSNTNQRQSKAEVWLAEQKAGGGLGQN